MSSEHALVVSFTPTEGDLFRFMETRPSYFTHIGYWLGVVWVAFGISLIVFPITLASMVLGAGAAVLASLLGIYGYRSYLRGQARRWCRDTPGAAGMFTLEISPEGVCWLTEVSESSAQWCVYGRVDTNSDFLLFYRGGKQASIIPLRAFSSSEEAEKFVRAAKEWHAAAARTPSPTA
jgi:hypothetical protein